MPVDYDSSPPAQGTSTAEIRQAMTRGFFSKCPNCGEGKMFRAYLKVADECPACGEPLHHQQADDFPAYIVIVLVGHIVVPLVLAVETAWAPPTWLHMMIWPALIAVLALSLLQPVKGAIVALQWVLGMHGFEDAARARSEARGAVLAPGAK